MTKLTITSGKIISRKDIICLQYSNKSKYEKYERILNEYIGYFSKRLSLAIFVKENIISGSFRKEETYISLKIVIDNIIITVFNGDVKDFKYPPYHIAVVNNTLITDFKIAKDTMSENKYNTCAELVIYGGTTKIGLRSHYYRDPLAPEIMNLVENKEWYKYWDNKYGFLEVWKDDEQFREDGLELKYYFPYFFSIKDKLVLFTYDREELYGDIPRFICMRIDKNHCPEYVGK